MTESKYLELATVRGCFRTKADGLRWADEKRREGYDVSTPFNNPFAYSHKLPWEATAMARFEIESRRS